MQVKESLNDILLNLKIETAKIDLETAHLNKAIRQLQYNKESINNTVAEINLYNARQYQEQTLEAQQQQQQQQQQIQQITPTSMVPGELVQDQTLRVKDLNTINIADIETHLVEDPLEISDIQHDIGSK